jgi:hypothetical protein
MGGGAQATPRLNDLALGDVLVPCAVALEALGAVRPKFVTLQFSI